VVTPTVVLVTVAGGGPVVGGGITTTIPDDPAGPGGPGGPWAPGAPVTVGTVELGSVDNARPVVGGWVLAGGRVVEVGTVGSNTFELTVTAAINAAVAIRPRITVHLMGAPH
jgi:hypothetical protein